MPLIHSRCALGTVEVMGAVMQSPLAVNAIRVGAGQTVPCLSAPQTAHNMDMGTVMRSVYLFIYFAEL